MQMIEDAKNGDFDLIVTREVCRTIIDETILCIIIFSLHILKIELNCGIDFLRQFCYI